MLDPGPVFQVSIRIQLRIFFHAAKVLTEKIVNLGGTRTERLMTERLMTE